VASVVVAASLALILDACTDDPEVLEFAGPTMGTTYHATVVRPSRGAGREQLQGAIDSVLARVDRSLSTYDDASEISRFNRSTSTGWIPVSADLYDVVAASIDASEHTNGAFDITVAPLLGLWGFTHPGTGSSLQPPVPAPSPGLVGAVLASTGYRHLAVRATPPALRKAIPTLRIDVDGIAPGYAVDQVAAALDALGIADYIVEIGGEVYAHGRSPQNRPWRVAVEQPLTAERRPYAIVELDDRAISTSGDYRDVRIVGGRRVSHTIDPHTGAPVTHDLASVSILHRSTMLADAYATALMVMGPQAGFDFASQHDLAALFLVRPRGGPLQERSTSAFQRVRLRHGDDATPH